MRHEKPQETNIFSMCLNGKNVRTYFISGGKIFQGVDDQRTASGWCRMNISKRQRDLRWKLQWFGPIFPGESLKHPILKLLKVNSKTFSQTYGSNKLLYRCKNFCWLMLQIVADFHSFILKKNTVIWNRGNGRRGILFAWGSTGH